LPENADEVRIPVRFDAEANGARQTIRLYYYNPSLDTDATGNILCSDEGLVAVEREIPVTQTPIQDAVRLLLRGELTMEEQAGGITTEYPLSGFELEGASLKDGVLTLSFSDPNNATSGGSCRVGILWHQIRATAEQFDAVDEVRFKPEELFQP
jgi:spore germination protein GerM